LPSERLLVDHFSVDRITIRKALILLVEQGYVEKRAGIGTYVKPVSAAELSNHETPNILIIFATIDETFQNIDNFFTPEFSCLPKKNAAATGIT